MQAAAVPTCSCWHPALSFICLSCRDLSQECPEFAVFFSAVAGVAMRTICAVLTWALPLLAAVVAVPLVSLHGIMKSQPAPTFPARFACSAAPQASTLRPNKMLGSDEFAYCMVCGRAQGVL